MYYAFLDESGDVPSGKEGKRFLVVALIAANHQGTLALRRHVRKVSEGRRGKGAKKKLAATELKASRAAPNEREKLLRMIAGEDVLIVAVTVTRKADGRLEANDRRRIYQEAVATAIHSCAERVNPIKVIIDSRYTRQKLRDELEEYIHTQLDTKHGDVSITQANSHEELGLQAVDFVAWAIRQKHERGDVQYYEVIASKIASEVLIEAK